MIYHIRKSKFILLLLLIIGFCYGCTENNGYVEPNASPGKVTKPISQTVTNQIIETVSKKEEITDVKAVHSDKDLLVAIKLRHFDRFQLNKIEKNIKVELKKLHPNYSILVSADQKLYFELDKLEEKIQKNTISMEKLEKEIKEIKNLMKEQS